MAKRVRPIRPSEVGAEQKRVFPPEVIESFNELIARNLVNGSATFKQKDVVALMVEKGLSRKDIYDKGWLNVEELYRSSGWRVIYDKPGFNESYDPKFEFERKEDA